MNLIRTAISLACAVTVWALCSSPLGAQTDPEEITWIPRVAAPPVIDGEIDQLWRAQPPFGIAKVQSGTVEDSDDLSAVWYGLYDDTHFYFLIDTHDQVLESEAGAAIWRNDRIEVYFNMDNVKPGGNGHSGDNYQYAFHWNKPDEEFVNNNTWTGVEWAYTTTSYGYITEVKIPFTTLTDLNTIEGFSFGFDIAINDNDGFEIYDSVTYWWNSNGISEWGNIDGAGTVGLGELFDGNYAPVVSPLDIQIAVEGTVSNIDLAATDDNESDTLTFSAEDLPALASLVDNGDGTATISIDGQTGDANIYMFTVIASDGARTDREDVILILKDPEVEFQTPVIEPVDPTSVGQGRVLYVDIVASDLDSLSLEITAPGLPEFAVLTDNGDKTARLKFNPDFSVIPQVYQVTVEATDSDSKVGTLTFDVEVLAMEKLTVFYCDPVSGSMENDGSSEYPWSSLQVVFEAGRKFEGGDVIYLRDGYHGEPVIESANSGLVFIRPDTGAEPTFSRLELTGDSAFWHVSGVQISRSFAPEFSKATMVTIDGSNNTVSNVTVFTVPDISDWTLDDWLALPSNGVSISGTENLLEKSQVLNTGFAVSVSGSFNAVRGNHIQNFSGDGMRGLGNDLLFAYNTVTDNYSIDDNHDDGFQSWSTGSGGVGSGVVYRITLRGNTIIETTDRDRPFQGPLQGIGCFDGMFEDWVIENNVVIVNQYHGLALYGAVNCRIVNNTVIDQKIGSDPGPTWLTIHTHKRYGSATTPEEQDYYRGGGNLVRNNLVTDLNVSATLAEVDNNKVVFPSSFSATFVEYPNNPRLKEGSPAIDAGSNVGAPERDVDGFIRPMDGDGDGEAIVDWGAYEYGSQVRDGVEVIEVSGNQYMQVTLDQGSLEDGAWYAVQSSSDLVNWSPMPAGPAYGDAFDILVDSSTLLVLRDKNPVFPGTSRFANVMLMDSQ